MRDIIYLLVIRSGSHVARNRPGDFFLLYIFNRDIVYKKCMLRRANKVVTVIAICGY